MCGNNNSSINHQLHQHHQSHHSYNYQPPLTLIIKIPTDNKEKGEMGPTMA